jgi:hypothetical protein
VVWEGSGGVGEGRRGEESVRLPISSIAGGDLDKVWEIKTLRKERDEEARRLLEMAAKQVQPIMRKRKWQVKLLSEFW